MIRSEKTRQFIIESTAILFNKKGYTGTYLSDLTKATGLSKGSIYGNFKDKNEVAVEAFRYNYKQLTKKVSLKLKQIERADKKLITLLNHYKREYKVIFENGGCAILNTAVDSDDGNEMLRKEVTIALKNWKNKMVSIIETGIIKSELKQVDANCFAMKMIALIEGSIMMAKVLNEPEILLKNIQTIEKEIRELTIE